MRFSKNNKLKLDKTICVILPLIPSKIVYSSSFVIESSRPISITNAIFSSTRCIRIAKLFLSHCVLSYFSIALRIFFSTNCSNIWPIFLQSTFSFWYSIKYSRYLGTESKPNIFLLFSILEMTCFEQLERISRTLSFSNLSSSIYERSVNEEKM